MFLQGESCLCFVILKGRIACSLMFRSAWGLEKRQVGFWENIFLGQMQPCSWASRFQLECPGQMSSPCSLGSPKEHSCVPTSQGVSWRFRGLFPWFYGSDQNQLQWPSWDAFILHSLFPELNLKLNFQKANHYRSLSTRRGCNSKVREWMPC